MPLSLKMEELLRVVTDKRRDIVAAAGLSEESLSHHHATPTEMQDTMNNWRNDVSSWMSTDNQNQYWELKRRRPLQAHQFAKSRFTTYCHHISGCKFLLSKLIELPILRVGSAERPAYDTIDVVRQLLDALQRHKETDSYKNAVEASKKRMNDQERASKNIWWARWNLQRGKTLAMQRDGKRVNYFDLDPNDQKLVEDYDSGRAARTLHSLEAQRSPVYRCTHVEARWVLFWRYL